MHALPAPTGSLAAYGCIKALNTLLGSVSSVPELYPALEDILFPIMQKMISTDGQDLFDEVSCMRLGSCSKQVSVNKAMFRPLMGSW